ncbi:MAG: anaerobic ribonucleoside-triphosphate reductase activating protein [Corallococcus sp.]|nr:anaerobic ribonucleoside-triphosphate reductase activating protein [Corallococcus sp.]
MKIGGIMNLTLLDFPEKVACTVFTVGCNFRCPFCHNNTLVQGNNGKQIETNEALRFLQKRKNVLEGICLTGGEPLIQQGTEDFLKQIKDMGYAVKLDTNGAFPDKLQSLVEQKLVDYVAMDVKNSRERYPQTVGCSVDMTSICKSVEFLKSGVADYEFRTTITGNLHDEQSIEQLAKWLVGAKRFYLQKFENSGDLIDPYSVGCDEQQMRKYLEVVKKYVPTAELRGM